MVYGYVIAKDKTSGVPVVVSLPMEDVDWVSEGFANLPNSPFNGVWSVKKEAATNGVGKQWEGGS